MHLALIGGGAYPVDAGFHFSLEFDGRAGAEAERAVRRIYPPQIGIDLVREISLADIYPSSYPSSPLNVLQCVVHASGCPAWARPRTSVLNEPARLVVLCLAAVELGSGSAQASAAMKTTIAGGKSYWRKPSGSWLNERRVNNIAESQ